MAAPKVCKEREGIQRFCRTVQPESEKSLREASVIVVRPELSTMVRDGTAVYNEVLSQGLLVTYLDKAQVKVMERGDASSSSYARQVNGTEAQAALSRMSPVARALLHSGKGDRKLKNLISQVQTLMIEHALGKRADPAESLKPLAETLMKRFGEEPADDASLELDVYIHSQMSEASVMPGPITVALLGTQHGIQPLNDAAEPRTPRNSPPPPSENLKVTPLAAAGSNSVVVAESSLIEAEGVPKKAASLERAVQVVLARASRSSRLRRPPSESDCTRLQSPQDGNIEVPDEEQAASTSTDTSMLATNVVSYAALALPEESQLLARRLVELYPEVFPNLAALHRVGALLYIRCEHVLARDVARLADIAQVNAETAEEALKVGQEAAASCKRIEAKMEGQNRWMQGLGLLLLGSIIVQNWLIFKRK